MTYGVHNGKLCEIVLQYLILKAVDYYIVYCCDFISFNCVVPVCSSEIAIEMSIGAKYKTLSFLVSTYMLPFNSIGLHKYAYIIMFNHGQIKLIHKICYGRTGVSFYAHTYFQNETHLLHIIIGFQKLQVGNRMS